MSDDDPTRIYTQKLRPPPAPRLGEFLVTRGLIDRRQLFEGLTVQARHRCRIGDALVWLGHVERGDLELAAASRTPPASLSGGKTVVRSMPIGTPSCPSARPPADLDATRLLRPRGSQRDD